MQDQVFPSYLNSGFLQAQILFYLVLRIGYDAT